MGRWAPNTLSALVVLPKNFKYFLKLVTGKASFSYILLLCGLGHKTQNFPSLRYSNNVTFQAFLIKKEMRAVTSLLMMPVPDHN